MCVRQRTGPLQVTNAHFMDEPKESVSQSCKNTFKKVSSFPNCQTLTYFRNVHAKWPVPTRPNIVSENYHKILSCLLQAFYDPLEKHNNAFEELTEEVEELDSTFSKF